MNRLLAITIFLLSFGAIIGLQLHTTSSVSRVQGSLVEITGEQVQRMEGEHVFRGLSGDVLRRGEVIKTGNSFAMIEYAGAFIALANNTEVQLTEPGKVRLIGGRVFATGPITVTTPWLTTRSEASISVINYAWKQEVQILPLGASAVVENQDLGSEEIFFPATWSEETKKLSISEEPFNSATSSEAEFYTWVMEFLKIL